MCRVVLPTCILNKHLQRRHESPRNDSLLLLLAKASFLGVSFEAAIKEWILFA